MRKFSTGVIIAIAVVVLVLTATSAGVLTVSQSLSSSGTVTAVNVGVYSNAECTQTLTSINWGTISPGGSVAQTIYVKNTGNTQITLSMSTTNWNPPEANGPLTITWNKQGTTLAVGQSTAATLTLTASPSTSGITTFSVNIVITGTSA